MTPQKITVLWRSVAADPQAAREITFHNPHDHVTGQVVSTWWMKKDVEKRIQGVQREMLERPAPTLRHRLSATELYERTVTKGDQETARSYGLAATVSMRIAVLLLASLQGRYNKHVKAPQEWPSENELTAVYHVLLEMAGDAAPQWKTRAVSGIPVAHDDDHLEISTHENLILHLAAEAGAFMDDHVPVLIINDAEPTPLAIEIATRIEDKSNEIADILSEQQDLAASGDPEEIVWRNMKRKTMIEAVWNEPVSTLLNRYKVSGPYFTKMLRNARIPTPQKGFWAQVYAGKRPHPRGIPDLTPNAVYGKRDRTGEKRSARRREEDRNHGRVTTMQRPKRK